MLHVTHPRPVPGRQTAHGVEFIDGVADMEDLHPERELALLQHGFTVEKTSILGGDESPWEPLPEAIEGDTTPKTSRRRKSPR